LQNYLPRSSFRLRVNYVQPSSRELRPCYETNTAEIHRVRLFDRRSFSNLRQSQPSSARNQSAVATGKNGRTSREKHQGSYRDATIATDSGNEFLFRLDGTAMQLLSRQQSGSVGLRLRRQTGEDRRP